jgi:hypothetical protein
MDIFKQLKHWWQESIESMYIFFSAWSPIDSRRAVVGFGSGPNVGIADGQGNTNYSLPGSQTSDNSAVPSTDSRTAKPVDSRKAVPQNSRTPQA